MSDQAHTGTRNKFTPRKVALWFTYLFHPFALPVLLVFLIQLEFILEDNYLFTYFFLFFLPAGIVFMSILFFRKWRKKPVLKKLVQNDPMVYYRLLPALAIFAGTLLSQLFSLVLRGVIFSSPNLNILMATVTISLFIRWFYNISLHQITIGVLAGIAYLKFSGDEYHLVAMGFLTLALFFGRVQYYLEQHKVFESITGFALGAAIGYFIWINPDYLFWNEYF